jgi:hypothetical protein
MAGGYLPPVVAELRGDISDYKAKMGEARAEAAATADSGSASMNRFAKVGGAALLSLGTVAVSVAVLGVEAADKWEAAHARLETAVKNSGGTWDQWSGSVGSAESKAEKLGFTNTNVEESLAKLVPVTHSQKQATDDLALAEDIARGRHMDLESATQLLVKVETGHVGLLGRLGVATKDSTGATISQEEAIKRLSAMYGGDASAYAETFAGKMQVLSAEAEDLAKNIGVALIPVIETMVGGLADGANWLIQNKDAAIGLGVIVGGPLVFAMLAYVKTQALAAGGFLIDQWTLMGVAASEAADGVMVWVGAADAAELSAIGVATAVALPIAAAVALGYGLHTLASNFDETYAAFHRGEDQGKALASGWVDAAQKSSTPIKMLQGDLHALNVQHDEHLAAVRRDGGGFNEAAQEGIRYHTTLVALKGAIADTRKEHETSLAVTKAVATDMGVTIPSAAGLSSSALKSLQGAVKDGTGEFGVFGTQAMLNVGIGGDAMKGLVSDSQSFSKSIHDAMSQATDPFAHFGNQAVVSEGDMEQFFVVSQLKAQGWATEIQRLMAEGVDRGIVQQMAKAGPDSAPALDAFSQMVDLHGAKWVNDMEASGQTVADQTASAYAQMSAAAAVSAAEQAAVMTAAQDVMEGHGTAKFAALLTSSDSSLRAIANAALINMGYAQTQIDALHGKAIDVTLNDMITGGLAYIQANINSLHGTSVDLIVNERFNASTGQIPGTEGQGVYYPGAHGLVGLAHGGSAGMIVGPNQPVVIGEGLSKEAVVPYDNFGDMVATIRNTGRAADFFRAAAAAGGIPNLAGPTGSSSHDAAGIIPELVGAGVGGGGNVTNDNRIVINVAGSVVTERQLVDIVQEGLLRNGRQGRGPGLS